VAAARWLRKRLGRRGRGLLIIGGALVCWGSSFVLDPPATPGLQLLTDRYPIEAWAWLWVGAGGVAIASAFATIGPDKIGFGVAILPPLVWAVAYAVAVLNGDYSRGGFVAGWYLAIVGIIMWAATVPEYSVPPTLRGRKREGT
jgi:hypothetical protein